MKKYIHILARGKENTLELFQPGDRVVITEKLDGSNASIRLMEKLLHSFGRKLELSPQHTLSGFYEYAMQYEKTLLHISETEDIDHLVFFGEWTTKRKLNYGEASKKFYLFDVYDKKAERYLSFDEMKQWAERLGIPTVPVLYDGPFTYIEELESYVGRTVMATGGKGEGIVIRNQDRLAPYGQPLYTKWVTKEFSEIKTIREPKVASESTIWFDQFLTPGRIEKILFKLRDEDIITEFSFPEFPTIMRALTTRLIEDILEEEGDTKPTDFEEKDAQKLIGRQGADVLRALIQSEQAA